MRLPIRGIPIATATIAIVASLADAPAALAADPNPAQTLVDAIASGCHPAPDGSGTIAPADLGAALWKANPINPMTTLKPDEIIAAFIGYATGERQYSNKPNENSYQQIGQIVEGWRTNDPRQIPMKLGGIEITQANGQPVAVGDRDRLFRAIFLDTDNPKGFRFVCGKPRPVKAAAVSPPVPPAGQMPGHAPIMLSVPSKLDFTIAKEAGQLGKLKADEQKAGEISFTDDRVKKSLTYATDIAVGLRIPINGTSTDKGTKSSLTDANVIPFVSYDRQGGKDPTDKSYVNNLSFGVQTNGNLHFNDKNGQSIFSAYYAVSGRYETDDGLHSSAWFGEIDFEPIVNLPGNGNIYQLAGGGAQYLYFDWSATGVFDHSSVTDPWKKQALVDTSHYTRLGGNLSGGLMFRRWKSYFDNSGDFAWSIDLTSTLSERWNLGAAKGSAHLWSSKLSFSPSKYYSVSIGYDRGYELDSLAQKRQWKITLDLKR
jgi:hypothetical protein